MKKKITWIVVGSLILLIPLIFIVYNKMKIQNIFDEIYYDSVESTGEFFHRRSSLGDIKGMSSGTTNLTDIATSEGEKAIMESYESQSLNPPMKSLSIINNSTKKYLVIGYSYEVTSTIIIFFENHYDVSTKKLKSEISFIDSGKRITTKKEVNELISKYNITDEQLKTWYDHGLNKILLKDWVSVYPSNYSGEQLGNVDVIAEW
ncbi:hypothetical protein CKN73_04475 [Carnobacterium divergens]|uniref:TipC family immunity protein n=1 Tax=Carnobacterium divergens TaxID=2748 RepID=UPI00107296BC|nr:TipC family immunity protein [Carnobacterium divergens]TFJ42670.1 hypothetical protein CKN77_04400 [Carnobacterium divergens]TFJ51203.1 hypothetical protein CKN73_04475 [Carnobacterium divergens]TFJ56133.1 hypothetical protein CKN83_04415 [Carnobacterium divergens]TFJ62566.1 hypothetical protein CKN89_04500 [Carnobacterium divergens]TFJ72806.1 hypothetical protein CKN91_04420 [Carnobacterium divergens]